MKKITLVLTIMLLCLVLMACSPVYSSAGVSNLICAVDPPRFSYGDYIDKSQVVSVELVLYNGNEETLDYNVEHETLIRTLEKQLLTDFLAETDNLHVVGVFLHPKSVSGKCLKITFANENFDIISQNSLAMSYDSSGKSLEYLGTIRKYYIATCMARFFHK